MDRHKWRWDSLSKQVRARFPRILDRLHAAEREEYQRARLAADPDPTLISQLIETGRAEVER